MHIDVPAALAPLIERIHALASGAGLDAYAVGGSVRDILLRRPLHDLDIAVDRDAIAFARTLAADLGGHFVELDDVNAIARVVLDDHPLVHHIDVAELQGDLEHDLRRRDFTIDALAVPLDATEVIDVTGGIADLDARLVRMTAPEVFAADPLRLLRAARIASELRFDIDAATEREIRSRANDLAAPSAERVRDELARILALPDAYGGIRLLDRLALLDVIVPELAPGRGLDQPGGFHAYDVLEHNIHAVEALDVMLAASRPERPDAGLWSALWETFAWHEDAMRDYLAEELSEGRTRGATLKFAALLHDIAKPQTCTLTPDGHAHFYGHADLGAEVAGRIMRRLRFSARETRFVTALVAEHLRPVQLAPIGEAPTRRALYRFHRDLGDAAEAVLLLSLADAASARGLTGSGSVEASEAWLQHVRYMNSLLVRSIEEEGILHPPRLLTGHDIMSRLGLQEGPLVGKLLEAVREAQATGDVRDTGEALEFVRRLATESSSQDLVGDDERS